VRCRLVKEIKWQDECDRMVLELRAYEDEIMEPVYASDKEMGKAARTENEDEGSWQSEAILKVDV